MQMLSMILPHETYVRLLDDSRQVASQNAFNNKQDMAAIMEREIPYWRNEVVGNNPIQEAIVLDSLWRVLKGIPQFTGLYD